MKVWASVDVETSYVTNAQVYLGKRPGQRPEVGQAKRVVLDLVEGLEESGRNVTTDQHFTGVALAEELLSKGLTLLGTVNKNRREIPAAMLPRRDREVKSTIFAYSGNLMLVSHVPRRNRAVILLSTLHDFEEVTDDGVPVHIPDYNSTKGGVDNVDKLCHTYTTLRKTNRWPMAIFFHMLDVGALNAFVVWTRRHPDWNIHNKKGRRKEFLFTLAESLVGPAIAERTVDRPLGLHQGVKRAIQSLSGTETEESCRLEEDISVSKKRGDCVMCDERRRIATRCCKCNNFICKARAVSLCGKCHTL
ncbi:MAG: hypothetical protein AAGK05_16800 [Pseudomonadota bacterium]